MTERTIYGGFWIRFLAYLVDSVILFCAFMLLGVAFAFLGPIGAWLMSGIFLLGPLLYWGSMQASARQATFGKALLGLKVTDPSGGRISLPRSLGRELAKFLSAIPLMIGFVIAAFTGRKQALHDLVASTIVVREAPGHLVAALVVGVLGWLAPTAIVMFLGAGLMAGMLGILGGSMMEQAKMDAKNQQAVQRAPARKAPARAAVAPAPTPAAGSEALLATPLTGMDKPGTTRAGPAVLELDSAFLGMGTTFVIDTYLPLRKEFEDGSVNVIVSHVIDRSGSELYDPANSLEKEFFQRVSLSPRSSPTGHLAGRRQVHVKSGLNTGSLERVEGTLKLALPVKPLSSNFAGADANKAQSVHGVSILLKQIKGNVAEFQFHGDHARVVAANGFGADQKPVRRTAWSASGGSRSYTFSAPVARVEVVVAESLAQHAFPFTLTRTAGAAVKAQAPQAAAPAKAAPDAASKHTTAKAAKAIPSAAEKVATAQPVPAPQAPAKTAAKPEPKPVPATRPQPVSLAAAKEAPPAKPMQPARRRPAPDADARKCLEHADDIAVIRCAERYR